MLKYEIRKSCRKFLMLKRMWRLMLDHKKAVTMTWSMMEHGAAVQLRKTGLVSAELHFIYSGRAYDKGVKTQSYGYYKTQNAFILDWWGVYMPIMCTSELVLKTQCNALLFAITTKSTQLGGHYSLLLSENLETKVFFQFIWNQKAN